MSNDRLLLKKLVSLVCAASSVGLSASAAETGVEEDGVVSAPSSENENDREQNDEEQNDEEQNDGFVSMSSPFDFTYSKSAWTDRIAEDIGSRVGVVLPLDGLGGRAGELGVKFRDLVVSLAGSCYEVRRSFVWSEGYVNESRLDSLLSSSSELWGAVVSVCDGINRLISLRLSYSQLRASFRDLSESLSNVVRILGNIELGGGAFLDFVRSNLLGDLRACDAVLAKRRIKVGLESRFSEQLDSVVVESGAGEAVDAAPPADAG